MRENILITGASGFVGSSIVKALARKEEIDLSCLCRSEASFGALSEGAPVRRFIGDVTKPETLADAVGNADIIIHCAALMSNFDEASRNDFFDVNVRGTENMLGKVNPRKIRRFIHISTAGVYGPVQGEAAKENHLYGSRLSSYEWSKREAEKVLFRCASERKIPFTVLRPSQMYGEGMYYGWPHTIKMIRENRMIIPGKGKARIHLLHIRDLVRAVELVLSTDDSLNNVYNIAGPEIVTLGDVFDLISEMVGSRKPARMPFFPVYMGSRILSFVPRRLKTAQLSLLTPHRVRFFTEDHYYNTRKAERELSFRPNVCLRDGFAAMIGWCEQTGVWS